MPGAEVTTARGRARMPLTPEQGDLAMSYLPLARALARPLKERWPSERDEFESAACLALVEAAEAFDPGRGVKFATFARHRISGALRDVQRRLVALGWRKDPEGAPTLLSLREDAEWCGRVLFTTPEPAAEATLEDAEAFERRLRPLPPRHAAACRAIYDRGLSQAEAAAELGCSQSRLSIIHREAMGMIDGSWYARSAGP